MNKSCASWYGKYLKKYLMYIIWVPNGIARCYPPTDLWNMWFFAFLQCPSWTRLAKWPNADGAGPRSYPGPPKHHWLSSNLTQLLGTVCLMRSGKLFTHALLVVSNRHKYCLCTYTTQKNWTHSWGQHSSVFLWSVRISVKSSYLNGLLQLQSFFCVQFSCKKESKQPELSTSLQKPTSELTGNVIQHRKFPNICHQDSYWIISNIYINLACKFSWHLQDKNQPTKMTFFFQHQTPGQQGLSTCHTTTPGSGRAFGWRYKVLMDGQCHCLETACFRHEWTWIRPWVCHGFRWIWAQVTIYHLQKPHSPMSRCQGVQKRFNKLSRGRFFFDFFEKTHFLFSFWMLQDVVIANLNS